MEHRPHMHARDSSGNKVSLLNVDAGGLDNDYTIDYKMARQSSTSTESSSLPSPPSMIYNDVADSGKSWESTPRTPISPAVMAESEARAVHGEAKSMSLEEQRTNESRYSSQHYLGYAPMHHRSQAPYVPQMGSANSDFHTQPQQLEYRPSIQTTAYGHLPPLRTESYAAPQAHRSFSPSHGSQQSRPAQTQAQTPTSTLPPQQDGVPKRFACRYVKSHNCDKTFTTSGHASRHAKIHTAEKSILCSYEGCGKKFTRNDNMKQHLETHKSRKNSESSRAEKKRKVRAARGSQQSSTSRSSTPVSSPSVQTTNVHFQTFQSPYIAARIPSPNMQYSSFPAAHHSVYDSYDPRLRPSVDTPPELALALHQAAVADAEDALMSSSIPSVVSNAPPPNGRSNSHQPTALDEEAAVAGLVGLNGHYN